MAAKKYIFVEAELEWAEEQLISWRAYVDANPLHELKDRIEWKPTAKGGTMPMVIASIEAQGKFIQETMKNYLALLEVVEVSEVLADLSSIALPASAFNAKRTVFVDIPSTKSPLA